jgi:hypothetical protein
VAISGATSRIWTSLDKLWCTLVTSSEPFSADHTRWLPPPFSSGTNAHPPLFLFHLHSLSLITFCNLNEVISWKTFCSIDQIITVIKTWGLYCCKIMPFGLKNVGATYQRFVNTMFRRQIGRNMEVYVDNILVKSIKVDREEHIVDLEETFGILRQYHMKLNPSRAL